MGFKDNLEDSYRHKGLRRMLVKEITSKGIRDERVLKAMAKVPRHLFFDDAFLEHAYEDKAFPIGQGQTISQPYTVARQTELLQVQRGDRILEIGTGSGYQACILLEVGAEVHTIEYNEHLYEECRHFLPRMGYQPYFYSGDGSKGIPEHAPFDGIIVTAGAPTVPASLVSQLKKGGRLIIPVGNDRRQMMLEIIKGEGNKIRKKEHKYFSFVPLLGEFGWNE